MNNLDYWGECIDNAADGCGLAMTPEQRAVLIDAVVGGHECYSMSFYEPEPPHIDEIAKLRRELAAVREAARLERIDMEDAAQRERTEIRIRMNERIANLRETLEAEREAQRIPGFASKYR